MADRQAVFALVFAPNDPRFDVAACLYARQKMYEWGYFPLIEDDEE